MNEQKMPQKAQLAKPKDGTAKAPRHPKNDDKLFYMKFRPDFISDLRDSICAALKLETHADLPLYFRSPYAFPAAIGIAKELEKRYGIEADTQEQKTLGNILGRYFRSSQYVNAMCDMPRRYTLDMDPSDAVQDGERFLYKEKLRWKIKAAAEKRKRKLESESRQGDAVPAISAAPDDLVEPSQSKPV